MLRDLQTDFHIGYGQRPESGRNLETNVIGG